MPNLIEVQKDSYNWFLEEGLKEVFSDISPITDFSGKLSLEFVDFTLKKMQSMGWGSTPEEKEYWAEKGWLGSARPWKT